MTYEEILRANIKRVRKERGLQQTDLVPRMRELGLARFTQSTIAAIETGKRPITLTEWLLLPRALQVDVAELVTLPPGVNRVTIAGRSYNASQFRALMNGQPSAIDSFRKEAARAGLWASPTRQQYRLADAYGLDPEVAPQLIVASLGSAEQTAARKLHKSAYEIVAAAFSLWGRSLSDERDEVLRSEGMEGDQRALRGHVTRRLLGEIRGKLEKRAMSPRRRGKR